MGSLPGIYSFKEIHERKKIVLTIICNNNDDDNDIAIKKEKFNAITLHLLYNE